MRPIFGSKNIDLGLFLVVRACVGRFSSAGQRRVGGFPPHNESRFVLFVVAAVVVVCCCNAHLFAISN